MTLESLAYVTRLGPDFYLVEGPYGGRFPYCIAFLFTGKQTALIDTGISEERIREIDRIKRIDMVLFSHSHSDHISNWHVLADRHLLYPKEMPDDVYDLNQLGKRFTGSREDGIYWVGKIARELNITPMREPDGRYSNGECFDFGNAQLEAIHCPGHLKDHYCFYEKTSDTLLTTDIDFSAFGPWFGNPEGDLCKYLDDIDRMKSIQARQICCSHKNMISEDASNYFDLFLGGYHRQQQKIRSLCIYPKTIKQLVAESPLYNHKFPDRVIQEIFERNMISQHVKVMVSTGMMEQVTDTTYVAF